MGSLQKKHNSCERVDDDCPRYIILIILYRVCSFIDKQISYYYFLNYLYLMVGRVRISTVPLLLDFIDSFRVILVLFFICIIAKYWSTTFGNLCLFNRYWFVSLSIPCDIRVYWWTLTDHPSSIILDWKWIAKYLSRLDRNRSTVSGIDSPFIISLLILIYVTVSICVFDHCVRWFRIQVFIHKPWFKR